MSFSVSLSQQVRSVGLSGEQCDFAVGPRLGQIDGEVNAGHLAHDDVTEHDVGFEALYSFNGALSAVNGHCLMTFDLEYHSEGVGYIPLIVDDENAGLV